MPRKKTAGYIVIAYQPGQEINRIGVCVCKDGDLLMTFSGQGGTLFRDRKSAARAVKKADAKKVGKQWELRQHFVTRLEEQDAHHWHTRRGADIKRTIDALLDELEQARGEIKRLESLLREDGEATGGTR